MLQPTPQSPAAQGYRQPPEWQPHSATWTAWPHDDDYWGGVLEPVRQEFAQFLNQLSQFEPIHLLVNDLESETDACQRLKGPLSRDPLTPAQITLHPIPHRDLWLRDSGPLFIQRGPDLSLVNWDFNAWGNKFPADLDNQIPTHIAQYLTTTHSPITSFTPHLVLEGGSIDLNSQGVALTTRQCLLAPNRNPDRSQQDLEQALADYLGITKILWLENGLEGDHTDGHIDTITRFVDDQTIVTVLCEDPADPNYVTTQANLAQLREFRDLLGQPFRIVTLPTPVNRLEFDGDRLPPSYANFYIANGAVLVPIYGDPMDDKALAILRDCFPDRLVVGCMARFLICGGGAFHCTTQQQPLAQTFI